MKVSHYLSGILFLTSFFGFQMAHSQSDGGAIITASERKGDKNFYNFAYASAIEFYTDALKSDTMRTELKQKIADSYRKLNDPENAAIWYSKVVERADFTPNPETYLYYAQALSSNEEYDRAKEWYEKYRSVAAGEKRVNKKLEGLNNLQQFYSDSVNYKIKKVSANSAGPDFSPMWYQEGIVFVSTSEGNPYARSEYSWDNTNYLDLFYSVAAADGDLDNPRPFNSKVNTKYHEGPLTFYDGEQKVVFTRNNYYGGKSRQSKEGITTLELYFGQKSGDGWGKIEPFAFNDIEYSVGHPTITEDGTKMFFASDMPGGFGGTDIYVTYYENDSWTEPKNLGGVINTEGMEMFPYLNNSTLYFSSNGHEGLGGLDVYKAPLVNDQPVKVTNLGYPVSSSYDDFSLIINKDERYGYFSTNRDDKIYDDIYYFLYNKEAYAYLRGVVVDNHSGVKIPLATVSLLDASGAVLADTLSDGNAEFEFKIVPGRDYVLSSDKLGYVRINTENARAEKEDDLIEGIVLKLEPPHFVISITVTDDDTKEIIPDAYAHVTDRNKNEVVEISLRDALHHEFETEPDFSYTIIGSKEGYFTNTIAITRENDNAYDTLFYEVPIKKFEIGKAIKIDNIYYDLDKADIRKDAAIELDKLVKILVDNPTIKIELSSHTDSRGSDAYNLNLSQRRAESAVAYVVSKGIEKSRIQAKGYGETQLVNECSNGVVCSTEAHQENRRTEFKVVSN